MIKRTRSKWIRDAKKLFLLHLMRNGTSPIEIVQQDLMIPDDVDKRFLGSAVQELATDLIIRKVDFTNKKQPGSHSSPVRTWEIMDISKAKDLVQIITAQQKSETAATDSP